MTSRFQDISPEEEARLPLPENWIRAFKISSDGNGGPLKIYRNIKTSQEMREHPLLLQALSIAKKRLLPFGWSIKEIKSPSGGLEYYYYNADLNLSLWDHPALRDCLVELLLGLGLDLDYISSILYYPNEQAAVEKAVSSLQEMSEEQKAPSDQRSTQKQQSPRPQHPLYHQEQSSGRSSQDNTVASTPKELTLSQRYQAASGSTSGRLSPLPPVPPALLGQNLDSDGEEDYHPDYHQEEDEAIVPDASSVPHAPPAPPQDDDKETETVDVWERWKAALLAIAEPVNELEPHREGDVAHLPVSLSSLNVLRQDVENVMGKVHRLLLRLRSTLAADAGYHFSLIGQLPFADGQRGSLTSTDSSEENDVLISLASDIVTQVRQQPQLIVQALTSTSPAGTVNTADGNNAEALHTVRLHLAFVVLHRLLHPFSADASLTTALLLEALNHQLSHLSQLEDILPGGDQIRRDIIARALFLTDPEMALAWDPLAQPLSVVGRESVLTCLLRCYALRRDVTAFYRAVWLPVLPALSALLQPISLREKQEEMGEVAVNLLAAAHRFIDVSFSTKALAAFPSTAVTLCRAVQEIGGREAVHYMIFHLLLLPNLIKVVGGDPDSLENEEVIEPSRVRHLVNKHFDVSWWVQALEIQPTRAEDGEDDDQSCWHSLDILSTFIWLLWRLFSCAAHLTPAQQDSITPSIFIGQRLAHYNTSSLTQRNIRQLVRRSSKRIYEGLDWLMQMPGSTIAEGQDLDVMEQREEYGDNYGGGGGFHSLEGFHLSREIFKPAEMLNTTLVSRRDLITVCLEVGLALDKAEVDPQSAFYQALSTFLSIQGEDENDKEEMLALVFLYPSGHESDGPLEASRSGEDEESLARRQAQLLRGLRLSLRYESSLIDLLQRMEAGEVATVHHLAEEQYKTRAAASSSSSSFVSLEKHTVASWRKSRTSRHGLVHRPAVLPFPLFSQTVSSSSAPLYYPQEAMDRLEERSLLQLQNDAIASLRFGSSAHSAGVGSSMARSRVLPARLSAQKQPPVTRLPAKQRLSSRRCTQPVVTAETSYLHPTQSVLNTQKGRTIIPLHSYEESFRESLRNHEIIPTDAFRRRYERRKQKGWYFHGQDHLVLRRRADAAPIDHRQISLSVTSPNSTVSGERRGASSSLRRSGGTIASLGSSGAVAASSPRSPAPRPFPEHLRYRIRTDDDPTAPFTLSPPPPASSPPASSAKQAISPTQASESIARFHTNVLKIGSSDQSPRARSPGMPRPFETSNHLLDATEAVMRRYHAEESKPVELRDYPPNEFAARHSEPFLLTRAHIYPPTGPRIPRIPDHLQVNEEEYEEEEEFNRSSPSSLRSSRARNRLRSRSRSRSGSRSRSRSRSSSRSPSRSRPNSPSRYLEHTESSRLKLSSPAFFRPNEMGREEMQTEQSQLPYEHEQQEEQNEQGQEDMQEEEGGLKQQRVFSPPPSRPSHSSAFTAALLAAVDSEQLPSSLPDSVPLEHYHNAPPIPSAIENQSSQRLSPALVDLPINSADYGVSRAASDGSRQEYMPQQAFAPSAQQPKTVNSVVSPAVVSAPSVAPVAAPAVSSNVDIGPSTYSIRFSERKERVDLKADREEQKKLLEERYAKLRQQQLEEEQQPHVDGEPPLLQNRPTFITPNKPYSQSQSRGDDNNNSTKSAPERVVPLVKRKSVFAEGDQVVTQLRETGIHVVKYGRAGAPKRKILRYDEDTESIQWSNVPGRDWGGLLRGFSKSSAAASATTTASSIPLTSIREVCKGVQTDVLRKAGLVDPTCCLSIISAERSLDVSLGSLAERDSLLRGLRALLGNLPEPVRFI